MDQSALILRTAAILLALLLGIDAKVEIISSKNDVMVGEFHFLLCKASREGDITWMKDGQDVDEDAVTTMDETTSKLSIIKAKMEDAGTYTCQCEFESGDTEKVSRQLDIYDGPSFGDTQTYHEFLEGHDVVLPCRVSGLPAVETHWLRNMQEISTHAGSRVSQFPDNSLHIGQVKRRDGGKYMCKSWIRGRPGIFKELSISVVVNAPPTVHLREEVKRVLAGPEANVSLVCLVDGFPQPNISWDMPVNFDPSRHHYNSDRSELTIRSVTRADYGEYVCTAKNKIAESSATVMLNVSEAPEVFVSADEQRVSVGQSISVSCNVTGHPLPQLYWINKHNGRTLDSGSGRVHVLHGVLMIDDVAPSDGGLYSCMAVSPSGNASRDFALHTQPSQPLAVSVSPGPISVLFAIKYPPIDGGTRITSYVMQWRQPPAEKWEEMTVLAQCLLMIDDVAPSDGDRLAIISLLPYTSYAVRLAAINAVGVGRFSETYTVRTEGEREPDSPVLLANQMKVKENSFSVPLQQHEEDRTPVQHISVRYRPDKEGEEWKEMQLSPDATAVVLPELLFGSDYQLEVVTVNANGSSMPAKLKFTIPADVKPAVTKGAVVGIVIAIFFVLLVAVDATCCYANRCGLLMFVAVKLFGHKVPGLKTLEEGEGNGELNLKGLATPRGSVHKQAEVQKHTNTEDNDVTCDKVNLTKYEKTPHNGDLPANAA